MCIKYISLRLKNTRKKKIKVYLFVFLFLEVLISLLYLYDFNLYINIQVGFISSLIVTISSFFSYKRFVNSSLVDHLNDEEKEIKKINKKMIFSSLGGFFSYYRLIGYVVFVICFMYVLDSGLLNVVHYIIGMTLSFIVPLTLLVFSKRKSCEKDHE